MTPRSKKAQTRELQVSPDEIRRRAYEIFLERGGLPGGELEDWLQAEYELQNEALFTPERDGLQQRI
jgi:hypothetical protein